MKATEINQRIDKIIGIMTFAYGRLTSARIKPYEVIFNDEGEEQPYITDPLFMAGIVSTRNDLENAVLELSKFAQELHREEYNL